MFDVYDTVERTTIGVVCCGDGKERMYVLKEDGDDWRMSCPKMDAGNSYDSHKKMKVYCFYFEREAKEDEDFVSLVKEKLGESELCENVDVEVVKGKDGVNISFVCPRDIRDSDIPDGLYVSYVRTFLEDIIY